jgi:hypothetical protein
VVVVFVVSEINIEAPSTEGGLLLTVCAVDSGVSTPPGLQPGSVHVVQLVSVSSMLSNCAEVAVNCPATDVLPESVKEQVPSPEHGPDHPVKTFPAVVLSVQVTTVPDA